MDEFQKAVGKALVETYGGGDENSAAEKWQRILEGKMERASERPRGHQRHEVQAAGAP